MRMRNFLLLFLLVSCCLAVARSAQGQQSNENARKIVRKVDPTYPEMARRMNIAGTVKLFAVVAPDGTVKAFEPVGGSPLLVQASEDAIKRWKFAPAAAESKELIELHFHPE
ncbi:MAG: energy transducer TonB [Candidatus Sulfotelmatobacter sp.]